MTDRRELTAEEKAKPYAKYYYLPSARPAAHHAVMLADLKPLDPARADRIQDANNLLSPGYTEGENGYCVMPDGGAYIALRHPMPGATPEMIDWWFAWHGLEDLRYKLWYPEMHVSASLDPDERAKVLDPSRTLPQKFQGLTHHVVEDIGGGVLNAVDISFLTPEDFGFDMSRYKHPDVATTVCSNITVPPADPRGHPGDIAMVHFVRELPGGIEIRNRFWLGYRIIDKQPVLMLPPGSQVKEQACFGLFEHDIHEFSRLAGFLPQLYAEEQGRVN